MVVSRLIFLALLLILPQTDQAAYRAEIAKWRRDREAALKADDSWLTVVGLFWLKEGRSTVGTDQANDFVLPENSAPGQVGFFEFRGGRITFQPVPGVGATVNGRAATRVELKPDSAGSPDIVRVGGLSMFVIQRGQRYGIRLKDKNSEARRKFTGLNFYPVKPYYRIRANFVPYNPPKMIPVPNILGDVTEEPSPGYVEFTLNGQRCWLDAIEEGNQLFFIFKDLTAGKETYPAGRFLYAEKPEHGEVVLDFNKAYNPPCAFTEFATCPLPPRQNHLPIRVEAGELRHGH